MSKGRKKITDQITVPQMIVWLNYEIEWRNIHVEFADGEIRSNMEEAINFLTAIRDRLRQQNGDMAALPTP
jgi:hypothetical protein